ncbi:hypothetical protein E2542_SST04630 [Spatholobus suberectus]|nr:hypothetical protein E2542_SST04630 [Spatholobus suberectus]
MKVGQVGHASMVTVGPHRVMALTMEGLFMIVTVGAGLVTLAVAMNISVKKTPPPAQLCDLITCGSHTCNAAFLFLELAPPSSIISQGIIFVSCVQINYNVSLEEI